MNKGIIEKYEYSDNTLGRYIYLVNMKKVLNEIKVVMSSKYDLLQGSFLKRTPNSSNSNNAWNVGSPGNVNNGNNVYNANGVRPVLYLDSEQGKESGTGTSLDPYRLSV